jgi:uncharacterized protein (TIGR02466 family)
MDILGVFPIPVGVQKLDRPFTKEEEECFNLISQKTFNNYGNLTSCDTNVLDRPELENLKKFCLDSVNLFVKAYNPPKNFLSFYITQSWINYTKQNQSHHSHYHHNSFISGVFYLNANIKHDKIYFVNSNPIQPMIKYTAESFTQFNSEDWFVPVETSTLLLFPSSLKHFVAINNQPYQRVSLSFNTFVEGLLGEKTTLTELVL